MRGSAPSTSIGLGVAIALVAIAAWASAPDVGQPLMRIHFIPFAVQTHGPVTRQDIQEAAFYRLVLGRSPARSPREPDPPLTTKLPVILRARPAAAKLAEEFIRLKVEAAESAYYVDNRGVVLESTSGRTFQLSRDEMQRIHDEIVGLRGVVDVDVCSGLSCLQSQ
jgi:hypothetical protein